MQDEKKINRQEHKKTCRVQIVFDVPWIACTKSWCIKHTALQKKNTPTTSMNPPPLPLHSTKSSPNLDLNDACVTY